MVGTCSPAPMGTDPESECGGRTCNGMRGCVGDMPRDAGMMGTDSGPRPDGGPEPDAGMMTADAGMTGGGSEDEGGCGCEVPGRRHSTSAAPFLLGALAFLGAALRRTRRRPR
jgi:hypothetical protein